MRAYIDRARTHGEFMEKQCAEFEVGKRHLARIMGKDPNEDFTQVGFEDASWQSEYFIVLIVCMIVCMFPLPLSNYS